MVKSAKRALALPAVSIDLIYSVVVIGGFLMLLGQDRVPALIVYLLQLYLAS